MRKAIRMGSIHVHDFKKTVTDNSATFIRSGSELSSGSKTPKEPATARVPAKKASLGSEQGQGQGGQILLEVLRTKSF